MSQQDAQKSEVHESTDDATTSPTNVGRTQAARVDRTPAAAPVRDGSSPPSNFERGAADRDIELTRGSPDEPAADAAHPGQVGGGPGAGDASSGGGAGAGIPGGGTDMRTGGAFAGGDVNEDRGKLFPDADAGGVSAGNPGQRAEPLDTGPITPDESDYGGPARIDTDIDIGGNQAPQQRP